jgi:hypothetical protein
MDVIDPGAFLDGCLVHMIEDDDCAQAQKPGEHKFGYVRFDNPDIKEEYADKNDMEKSDR